MIEEKFTIGENRTRPPYLPKTIRCPSCNAPISLYSEQSQLVVCESCGENLDCSKEELVALGKLEGEKEAFELSLHQEFRWSNQTYKIIARMILLDRWGDKTAEYLLFHPFKGVKWLSIYRGEDGLEFSLSEEKHSLALENPFGMKDNSKVKTGEKTLWLKESESNMRLLYVDGTLSWLAKVGDSTQVVEYIQAGARKNFLTVEKANAGSSEIEYSYSKKITKGQFIKAIGVENAAKISFEEDSEAEPPKRANPMVRKAILALSIVGILLFGFLSFRPNPSGEFLSFSFPSTELKTELGVLSPSFKITDKEKGKPFLFEARSERIPKFEILRVEDEDDRYVSLAEWEKEKLAEDFSEKKLIHWTKSMYTSGYYGSAQQEMVWSEEGTYRFHVQFSHYDRPRLSESTSLAISIKRVHLQKRYWFMFFFSIWALLIWRKL